MTKGELGLLEAVLATGSNAAVTERALSSVVVLPPADGPSGHAQHEQDQADDHRHDPDSPKDRDLGQETDEQQVGAQNDNARSFR